MSVFELAQLEVLESFGGASLDELFAKPSQLTIQKEELASTIFEDVSASDEAGKEVVETCAYAEEGLEEESESEIPDCICEEKEGLTI